jgi:peptidyl-prolyl cis-trans isomerase A (cyclophilin A)
MIRGSWAHGLGMVGVALLTAFAAQAQDAESANPLMDPTGDAVNQAAPDLFQAKFETSKGDIIIEVQRDWSPRGAQRFYNLVNNGFYDGCRFFRVISGFMAQIGINGDPAVMAKWRTANIMDDKVTQSNTRGFVSFAKTGAPNSRSTQIFINYKDNSMLDPQGFSPFGRVIEGMEIVDNLYAGYGEGGPRGQGPSQQRIQSEGNAYLEEEFPNLDYVKKATILTTGKD